MRVMDLLFGKPVSRSDQVYGEAMRVSDDLLTRMKESSHSTDAARAIMSDVWAQNHNIPYLTTVHEAVQEMNSPVLQKSGDK